MAGFQFRMTGTAFDALSRAAQRGRATIMAAVNRAAHTVQAGAKINVHQKLNATGLSKGTLSRSITVLSHAQRLEAEIGPSVIYGRIHELGGEIKPINAKFLVFKVPVSQAISYKKSGGVKAGKIEMGETIFAKKVTIPARPYLQPALDEAQPEIKTIFQDEIRGLLGGG